MQNYQTYLGNVFIYIFPSYIFYPHLILRIQLFSIQRTDGHLAVFEDCGLRDILFLKDWLQEANTFGILNIYLNCVTHWDIPIVLE